MARRKGSHGKEKLKRFDYLSGDGLEYGWTTGEIKRAVELWNDEEVLLWQMEERLKRPIIEIMILINDLQPDGYLQTRSLKWIKQGQVIRS